MDDWKSIDLCGAGDIERVCNVYEIYGHDRLPAGYFKIKVMETREGIYDAVANVALKGPDAWLISLAGILRDFDDPHCSSRFRTGRLLIPFAPGRAREALNRIEDARPTSPVGVVAEMAQVSEERIPVHLARGRVLEQARHGAVKRRERAHQQDGMERRALCAVGWA
ncbi:MAG: hypothetical protein ABI134_25965, partial [Byssovorax sp.]